MADLELFSILTVDVNSVADVLDVPDVFTDIGQLSVERPAGLYEMKISFTWLYDRTNNSANYRFSTDNGVTWHEFLLGHVDSVSVTPTGYDFPYDHPGGLLQLRSQIRKETAGGQLDVQFADVWFKRIG